MSQRTAYGGQAVIEGVMIRGKERVATACRLKDGSITVRRDEADALTQRHPWLRLAFLRGTPALIDSMRLGYRTLMWSADMAMSEEEAQPQKPSAFGYLTITLSFLLGIGLFVLLPTFLADYAFPGAKASNQHDLSLLAQLTPTLPKLLSNTLEGLLRVVLLVGYISLIRRSKEIRRLFAYHGAEHKVVNSWEEGGDLSVESAKRFSRIHPRCGTSFLFLFFFVGILLHALIGWPDNLLLRFSTRLLMIPIVAGIAYEIIRLAGRKRDSRLLRMLVWPGMLLQRLTTAEPTDDQMEVAICSLRTVLEDEGVIQPPAPSPAAAPSVESVATT